MGTKGAREGGRAPRKLHLLDATLLVMGGILGVGVFFNPGQVAGLLPHPPAFLAAWLVGGLIALCGAFTFAELGATFPRSGGWFVYLRECHGPLVAFLFAWVVLFVVSTAALAIMADFCLGMLEGVAPAVGAAGSGARSAWSITLLCAITAVALGGAKLSATFQNACMALKVGACLVLIAAGCLLFSPEPLAALPPPSTAQDPPVSLLHGFVPALLPILFSLGGWQMLGYAAGTVADAPRVLPKATILGVGAVTLITLLLNLDYMRVVGLEHMAENPMFAAEVARRSLGPTGETALRLGMAISAVGVLTVTIFASPWVFVAMAREGLFFARFARLHHRTGAPVEALCLQAVLAGVYVLTGDVETLVDSVVFIEWIFHGLAAAGLVVLFRRRSDLKRPFASPAFPLFPMIYLLAACVVVLGNLWQNDARLSATGLGVVGSGWIAYALWTRRARRRGGQ
ncbi:MAG: amino acid permease [Planctomycetota bacterium]|jgi:APA family basic amino acid/polyamine antiporter|nr:amino acid permease [Planctomycetota bacterium]MDP6763457.1 amino acid permease [Planctomycetota bacterium]MDP6990380.1 amino acid permease [Planctomycetota bacterium]